MQRIIRRTIITVFVLLVAILLLLWGLTPIIARTVLEDYFAEHNASFVAESLSLNPFTTTVGARNVVVTLENDLEFELDSLDVTVSLLPLLDDQVIVDRIDINGLLIDILELPDGWQVAGIQIRDSAAAPEQAPAEETAPSPWLLELPSVQLSDSRITVTRYADETKSRQITDDMTINSLKVTDVVGQGLKWKGAASLSTIINEATLDLDTRFRYGDEGLSLWLDIKLLTAQLAQFANYVPAPVNQGNLHLTLAGEVVVNQAPAGINITAKTSRFDVDRVSLPVADLAVESERTQLDLRSLHLSLPVDGAMSLDVDTDVTSTGSRIADSHSQGLLASWDELTIRPVQFSLAGSDFEVSIDEIISNGLVTSQAIRDGNQLPALVSMDKLSINSVNVTSAGAEINTVSIENLISSVILDEQRNLITLTVPGSSDSGEQTDQPGNKSEEPDTENQQAEQTAEAVDTTSEQEPDSFYVILNQLSVSEGSQVSFSDGGVTPAFEASLDISKLQVEGLNTRDPQQALYVVLEGKTGRYTSIKTDTRLWPFVEKTTVNTRTQLTEFNMGPVSPYVDDALGYHVESGQLDLDLKMDIDEGILDGLAKVELREFDLGEASHDASDSGSAGTISLNAAIGVLKDNNDNIELEVPMSGNVDSPEFGWGDFLSTVFNKALFEAASFYVMQSFVPYANVISVAQFAGEQMLKVRVEPLFFEPGQQELAEPQQTFARELATLMKDKEDMQMKACPYATLSDLRLETLPEAASEEQLSQLKTVATNRAEALKAFLVDAGIKSSRVLLCSPKVDSAAAAKPRIEFDL